MLTNSHNEAVYRDGEEPELGPGQCACGLVRKACPGCFEELDCEECEHGGRCICDDEPTVEVSLETSPGRVSLARHVELMTGGKR